jgi:hypothetical protein
LLVAVAALSGLIALPAPGRAASESCAGQVVSDWYDDQRLDETYPLHCYRDAIRLLPVDVRDYSHAEDDILRALQYARQGKADPGVTGGAETNDNQPDASTLGNEGGSGPSDPDGTDGGGEATEHVNTSGPSSIPIPLIVLGCFAGVLLAAGAIGYLTRRRPAGATD